MLPLAALLFLSPPALCKEDERVVFACRLERGQKVLSVCATPERITYRFGRPGRVEIERSGPTGATTPFRFSRYTRPGTTRLALTFPGQGGGSYTVFSDETEEGSAAGVRVRGKGARGREVSLGCKRPWTDRLMELEEVVPVSEH